MSFYKHKEWLISLDGIRSVRIIRSPSGGGPPYRDSGKITYEDGSEFDVPADLAQGVQNAFKSQTVPNSVK